MRYKLKEVIVLIDLWLLVYFCEILVDEFNFCFNFDKSKKNQANTIISLFGYID